MSEIITLKITDIIDEGNNIKTYIFNKPEDFNWDEGSHISIGLKDYRKDGKLDNRLIRKFSIFTMNYEDKVGITTRLDSSDSDYKKIMSELKVGDDCHIIEYGSRMRLRREDRDIALISMGVGMATMRPIIKEFLDNDSNVKSITNIIVTKTKNYLYSDELDGLESDRYKNLCFNGRNDFKNGLKNLELDNAIYYVVGSKEFLKETIEILKEKGADSKSIMIDKNEGIIEIYFDENDYENMEVKNYGVSKKFVPLVIPNGCACGGNCTCK